MDRSQRKLSLIRLTMSMMVFLVLFTSPCASYAQESATVQEAQVFSIPVEYSQYELVDRSWYGEEIAFSVTARTALRYFDGSSVGIEVFASCPVAGSFTVQLYRGNTYVGIAYLNRNGFSRAEWTNIGSGSYRFVFSKSLDGSTVTCSDVAMFSW